MQINHSRYNVNFGSNPLYRVKLKGGVTAKIAEVFPENPYDNAAVTKLLNTWVSEDLNHDYLRTFRETWSNVQNRYSFFVVELVEKGKALSDRIVAIACTYNPKNNIKPHNLWDIKNKNVETDFQLYYLQSINSTVGNKKISGAGETLIYGLTKLAQKYKFDMLSLTSTNDGFYEKIGFKTDVDKYGDTGTYFLKVNDYKSFLARVKEKYGF